MTAMTHNPAPPGASGDRQRRGILAHLSGAAAEDRIAMHYEQRGCVVACRRWRGPGGEIDLIIRTGRELVFVEVKKSRCFERAAERITPRQIARICTSAESYLAGETDGSLTSVRFDVALVDSTGAFRIVENAFGQP